MTYGNSKPQNNEFIKVCIFEIKELIKSGLDIFNKRIMVKLKAIPCDLPARSI